MQLLKDNHEICGIIGGRYIHPVSCIPGGMSKPITEDDRQEILLRARRSLETAKFNLQLFDDVVLGNPTYVDLVLSDMFAHQTYYMGLMDENNHVNFYDGKVRVVGPDGAELVKYAPEEYTKVISEHIEPWSYLKFPYLKQVGWKGFVDGPESGVYRCTPLSRLNAADGMATPLAQEQYERFYDTLGGKPVHATLATHWARLIEILYAAERVIELAEDPEITSPDVRAIPTGTPTEGVGIVEAPRGTLTHHYITDEKGILTQVNLIVGTTNNNAPISMSIKRAAQGLVQPGVEVTDGLLNTIEMAFRAYDPCFGCATHAQPGEMPLIINVYDHEHELVQEIRRD
jgi:F420-non-reducing hydrogenase large subunit